MKRLFSQMKLRRPTREEWRKLDPMVASCYPAV